MLKELCMLNSTSGDEKAVRDYIISQIDGYCEYEIDALGSIKAYKKGKKKPKKTVSVNAHMDEVGFIITDITDEGYLRFSTVGGIDSSVCLDRRVTVGEKQINGVIADKAFHHLTDDERNNFAPFDKLYIDIGAKDCEEAKRHVNLGDYAYFESEFYKFGDGFIKSKALDDRVGCMIMIELIKSDLEYDTVFCFNVQEEIGLRGSKCTSFAVQSDTALVIEATTAADLDGVTGGDRVCVLGNGAVVSFMDGATVYDRNLYKLAIKTAKENSIPVQTKTAIAGGNDAGAIQSSGKGCKTVAVSLPARYIHSASSVIKESDIDCMRKLIWELLPKLYD